MKRLLSVLALGLVVSCGNDPLSVCTQDEQSDVLDCRNQDLSHSDLSESDLVYANLSGANLTHADLSDAKLMLLE